MSIGKRNVIIGFILLSILITPSFALANSNQSIFTIGNCQALINGESVYMNTVPYIKDDRTFVPIRYIAYILGMNDSNIIWDSNSQTVTLQKGNKIVRLKIGSEIMLINGVEIKMDIAPEIKDNYTMLPASWVAQAFGATVSWDEYSKSVIIRYNDTSVTDSSSNSEEIIAPYKWEYKTKHWTWYPQYSFESINNLLSTYKQMPHPHHTMQDYITTYCVNTTSDEEKILSEIVDCFKEGLQNSGYDDYDTICTVIAFVQSFTYVSDSESTGFDEYPRYPLETLFSREGDCEDTAILTAKLIRELGYGSALIFLPGHCAVGIKGDDSLAGSYYNVNGVRYYYLETTAIGYKIGEIPEKYKNEKATVLPLP